MRRTVALPRPIQRPALQEGNKLTEPGNTPVRSAAERLIGQSSYDFERQSELRQWKSALEDLAGKSIV